MYRAQSTSMNTLYSSIWINYLTNWVLMVTRSILVNQQGYPHPVTSRNTVRRTIQTYIHTIHTVSLRTVSSEILDRIFLHIAWCTVEPYSLIFFFFLFAFGPASLVNFSGCDTTYHADQRLILLAVVSPALLTGPIVYLPDGSGAIFDWFPSPRLRWPLLFFLGFPFLLFLFSGWSFA